jgi:voltage-gated potassium channel Kch
MVADGVELLPQLARRAPLVDDRREHGLDAERADARANIRSFDDALWWSATTITTVGYGDHYPVTAQGRLVAAGLMLGGIALLAIRRRRA